MKKRFEQTASCDTAQNFSRRLLPMPEMTEITVRESQALQTAADFFALLQDGNEVAEILRGLLERLRIGG